MSKDGQDGDQTKEPQYEVCLEYRRKFGSPRLGLMSGHTWLTDPKRLIFVLARYKFVAKMFAGRGKVLEVGCADGFCSQVVRQEVGALTVVDFDPVFIEDASSRAGEPRGMDCRVHDMLEGPLAEDYDAAYCLDVIEHIEPAQEGLFMRNLVASLGPNGALIVGTPSLESQAHASPASKEGHINCKDHAGLREFLEPHFHHVFIFSMNDEVVHTGFYPMAHYLLALCAGRKD